MLWLETAENFWRYPHADRRSYQAFPTGRLGMSTNPDEHWYRVEIESLIMVVIPSVYRVVKVRLSNTRDLKVSIGSQSRM